MKERYALVRRAYPERDARPQALVAQGRLCRQIGRVCLLAAAFAGGVEIFNALRGGGMPPLTLRALLDLPPEPLAPDHAVLKSLVELVFDSPLWMALLAAAAAPYALAIERFLKAR